MMKWSVFCLVNVLFWVTYRNKATWYIVQIAKGRTNPVFAFIMQTPVQVECLIGSPRQSQWACSQVLLSTSVDSY